MKLNWRDKAMRKHLKLVILLAVVILVLTGCGVQPGNYLTPETATGWWHTLVVLPLIQFITWLADTVGNLGIAIIIATILAKIITLPFTLNQTKSTVARNALNPEVEKIKQKYAEKNDRESQMAMQQEINLLYKENGISMMAGCLPSLVQMPLMIAFFQSFSRHPLIVGAESAYFLGINLASVNLIPNYIFAILVAALMYYSQKRTQPIGNDPTTAKMGMMNLPMAIMMGGFVIFSPLAMGLYFLVSQIMMTLQGFLIKKPTTATT